MRVASSEAELACFPRVGPLPSSEAESQCAVEGLGGEVSSEAEMAPRVRGGSDGLHCEGGPWASLEPFFPFRWEEDCRLLWARLPNMCSAF